MKKIALWGILCLILVQSTYAQEWDSLLYKQIEKSIKRKNNLLKGVKIKDLVDLYIEMKND